MAGLKEVAARAGVSINTASRALRRSGPLSPQTMENVRRAAETLGYRPHRAARALRRNQSQDIAVVAESGDYLQVRKIAAIQEIAAANDYLPRVLFVNDNPQRRRVDALVDILRAERPAGAVFIGLDPELTHAALSLGTRLPTVLVAYDRVEGIDCVHVDRRQGVADAVDHLHERGRRRIAYLGTDDRGNKVKGYHDAMERHGLRPLRIPAEDLDAEPARVRAQTPKLLRQLLALPEMPDAVITSDYYAARLTSELPRTGRRVPEDVALVGFDNREFVELTDPPLTTVAQPNREVGQRAAELLFERIASAKDYEPRAVCVPMRLIVRASTPLAP